MKPPADAERVFRCDCGRLLGWIVGDAVVLRERIGRHQRAEWGRYTMARDRSDLASSGVVVNCGEHTRQIIGDDWTLESTKIIVRRHPDD